MCCGTHGTTRIAFTLAPGLIPAARGAATLKADQLDTVGVAKTLVTGTSTAG
jgi:hypothetical protein